MMLARMDQILASPATLAIIILTVLTSMSGFSHPDVQRNYLLDAGAIRRDREWVRLITSGFLHADGFHLGFNMFSLFFFGPVVEQIGGLAVFFAVYLGAIVGGGLLALFLHRHEEYHALGASGGVCGIIFAAIFFEPGMTVLLFYAIPMPAWLFAVLFIVGSAYGAKAQRDNIGHDAHLGGALVGLLIATAFYPVIVTVNPLLYAFILAGGIGGVIYLARTSGRGRDWR
jgi:membrane associated rhomboid family serine protease